MVSTPKKYTHLVRDPFFFFRGPFSYEALRYNKSSNLVYYDIIFGQRENFSCLAVCPRGPCTRCGGHAHTME